MKFLVNKLLPLVLGCIALLNAAIINPSLLLKQIPAARAQAQEFKATVTVDDCKLESQITQDCQITIRWTRLPGSNVRYEATWRHTVGETKWPWETLCQVTDADNCNGRIKRFPGTAGIEGRVIATPPGGTPIESRPANPTTPPPTGGLGSTPDDCGCKSQGFLGWKWIVKPSEAVEGAICQATCAVSRALGGLVGLIIEKLIEASGISVDPPLLQKLAAGCLIKPST